MSGNKYEPKPGEGTLFQNKRRKSDKEPSYKGYLVLPNGDVVGVALWKKDFDGGTLLSLKVDDREGEWQAKQLGRGQMTMGDTETPNRGRPTQQRQQRQEPEQGDFDDDDSIPF